MVQIPRASQRASETRLALARRGRLPSEPALNALLEAAELGADAAVAISLDDDDRPVELRWSANAHAALGLERHALARLAPLKLVDVDGMRAVIAWARRLLGGASSAEIPVLTLAPPDAVPVSFRVHGRPMRAGRGTLLLAALSKCHPRVTAPIDGRRIDELQRSVRHLRRELDHRVKNNLQIVASLLRLQVRGAGSVGERRSVGKCLDRVSAIAMAHDLAQSTTAVDHVDLSAYLTTLAARLVAGSDRTVGGTAFAVDVGDRRVNLDIAVLLGVVANELISNALNHTDPPDDQLRIEVKLGTPQAYGGDVFCVRDNGRPSSDVFEAPKAVGLPLVRAIAQQLGASVVLDVSDGGGAVRLVWAGRLGTGPNG